ncbi:hypothetical protein Celaphus_00012419, partial [Cervus elaphus hippelaphus]
MGSWETVRAGLGGLKRSGPLLGLGRLLPFLLQDPPGIKSSEEGPRVATVFFHTPQTARQEPQSPSPAAVIIGKLRGDVLAQHDAERARREAGEEVAPPYWCPPALGRERGWQTSFRVSAGHRGTRGRRGWGRPQGEGSSGLHTWPGAPWPPQNEPPLRKRGTHYSRAGVLRTTRLCKACLPEPPSTHSSVLGTVPELTHHLAPE